MAAKDVAFVFYAAAFAVLLVATWLIANAARAARRVASASAGADRDGRVTLDRQAFDALLQAQTVPVWYAGAVLVSALLALIGSYVAL